MQHVKQIKKKEETYNSWEYVLLNMGQVFGFFWCSETGTPKEKCGIAEIQIVAYNRAIFFSIILL